MMKNSKLALCLSLALIAPLASAKALDVTTESGKISVKTIATGLKNPWSLAVLPDGSFLVTERPGNLRIVQPNGTIGAPISGLPKIVDKGRQRALRHRNVRPAAARRHR